jgi:hypothetical protein
MDINEVTSSNDNFFNSDIISFALSIYNGALALVNEILEKFCVLEGESIMSILSRNYLQ